MNVRTIKLAGAALAVSLTLANCSGQAAVPQAQPTVAADIAIQADQRIVAEAKVVPVRSAALAMALGGTAAEVLVKEGDTIEANQVLVKLDTRRQAAAISQAEADVAGARAALARLNEGATEEQIAVAEAQLARAKAQLQQTTGGVTGSDIKAAEARLQEAQARLKEVQTGGRQDDIAAAQARLQEQQVLLQTERDRLSAAKTDAKFRMDQAVADLVKAQAAYGLAKENWDKVQATGKHPTLRFRLNDVQRTEFQNAFIVAEEDLKKAQTELQAAGVIFDAARYAEETGVRAAEQRVAQYESMAKSEAANTSADELAAAQAAVATAQAELDKLRGDERTGTVAVSQAAVLEAEANLAQLKAGATPAAIAEAEAEIQRAEAALQAQRVALEEMELRAPFTGVVAAVDVKLGEYVTPGTAIVSIGDPTEWQIETTDLTELGIVRVTEGAKATITFDALPDVEMPGTVTRIRALGENRQGDITYRVIIKPDQQDVPLRWNMTASVAIESK
jgi:HlyD family secretion protein